MVLGQQVDLSSRFYYPEPRVSVVPADIKSDIADLLLTDIVFKKSGINLSDFSWRHHDAIFPSLIRTIIGQQLSTKAANTIWQRVVDGVGDISPEGFQNNDDETLRGYGLSRPKISYIRGLVDVIQHHGFRPEGLRDLPDDEAIQTMTSLKGFGRWSAQMILIFTFHRRDIWPAGDLGIREGIRLYHQSDDRPDIPSTEKFGDQFKGRRTAASLLLWKLKD